LDQEAWIMRSSFELTAECARLIDQGVWRAGERLPPERVLAERYGLARNTVRRALQALEVEGRIVRQIGRGTFVKAGRRPADEMIGRIREASPADLMEVRLIIEPPVAALAASRATAEELATIREVYDRSVAARSIAEFEHWDARLHLAIFRAARNAMLADYCAAMTAARNNPSWHRLKQRSHKPELRGVYDRQHGDVVIALVERDAERARAAIHQHLMTVRANLLAT
jgi:DNA-binding FadR family transcriptional regulator